MPTKWRRGDLYTDPGKRIWKVLRVTQTRTALITDEWTKDRTMRGTVTLMCYDLNWEIIAPVDYPPLKDFVYFGEDRGIPL